MEESDGYQEQPAFDKETQRQPPFVEEHRFTGRCIETTVGGHVHIRFIDGGLVSIRPGDGRLHVQEYRKDSSAGRGAIRFQLEHGVVRSVTGNWGEHDRKRFRLNTPVIAIGIKGTDFVVKSSGDLTQASVISGAIVMSPLEGSCLGTLGPATKTAAHC